MKMLTYQKIIFNRVPNWYDRSLFQWIILLGWNDERNYEHKKLWSPFFVILAVVIEISFRFFKIIILIFTYHFSGPLYYVQKTELQGFELRTSILRG